MQHFTPICFSRGSQGDSPEGYTSQNFLLGSTQRDACSFKPSSCQNIAFQMAGRHTSAQNPHLSLWNSCSQKISIWHFFSFYCSLAATAVCVNAFCCGIRDRFLPLHEKWGPKTKSHLQCFLRREVLNTAAWRRIRRREGRISGARTKSDPCTSEPASWWNWESLQSDLTIQGAAGVIKGGMSLDISICCCLLKNQELQNVSREGIMA